MHLKLEMQGLYVLIFEGHKIHEFHEYYLYYKYKSVIIKYLCEKQSTFKEIS